MIKKCYLHKNERVTHSHIHFISLFMISAALTDFKIRCHTQRQHCSHFNHKDFLHLKFSPAFGIKNSLKIKRKKY